VSGYRHEPLLLVCPNGHSETFKAEGISKTLMGGAYTRVDNRGKVIETHDPNVETHYYRCDVCGARFTRRWQNGAMLADQFESVGVHLRPKTAPKKAERMERLGGR